MRLYWYISLVVVTADHTMPIHRVLCLRYIQGLLPCDTVTVIVWFITTGSMACLQCTDVLVTTGHHW